MNRTIPGYHYSTGPVHVAHNERTIPGYRYSFGPILVEEAELFTQPPAVPPKAPMRRLTKRSVTPLIPPPVPPKRPLRPDDPLVLAANVRSDEASSPSNISTNSPSPPFSTTPNTTPTHHTVHHTVSSSLSTLPLRQGTINSISSVSSKHTTTSSISSSLSSSSYKYAPKSSISSISSSHLESLSEKEPQTQHAPKSSISSITSSLSSSSKPEKKVQFETPTLTPLASAFVSSPSKASPTDSRLVFSVSPTLKPRPRSCFLGQLFKKKNQSKERSEKERERSDILLTNARESQAKQKPSQEKEREKSKILLPSTRVRTSMSQTPKSPAWLTDEEKRVVEEHRRREVERRLESGVAKRK